MQPNQGMSFNNSLNQAVIISPISSSMNDDARESIMLSPSPIANRMIREEQHQQPHDEIDVHDELDIIQRDLSLISSIEPPHNFGQNQRETLMDNFFSEEEKKAIFKKDKAIDLYASQALGSDRLLDICQLELMQPNQLSWKQSVISSILQDDEWKYKKR
ncbi:hypothetical protein C9374_007442 [Naegleria lovaniensis]|uniref:Uncharacterized protein n=1 Tax=Naegleria lovaniensis TaxID=51637 RepID=A0AA88KIW0_NAELO|nr:uncharacterized protein C9374_007442 [Naegleria lovaniensis]KAG2379303.1 hypothetical protein C9374_007442 [Naegleria lovaniensis]